MKIAAIGLAVLLGLAVLGGLGAVGGFYALKAYYGPKLPDFAGVEDLALQVPLRVYTADGKLMQEFGAERRKPLRYDQLPQVLVQAFLAAEDDRYFQHPGVDYQGLLRAAWVLAVTGEKQQGGSTITMQLARNFFLTNERTYERKIKEIFLALKIEEALSKEEIFARYVNKIFLGNRAYGVGAAAEVYYGAEITDISLSQAAMIAGLPKAPSAYNPIANPSRALLRRNYVLRRMRELNFITAEQFQMASSEGISAQLARNVGEVDAGYVAEMVRAEMVRRHGEDAYTGGYAVTTTLDSREQVAANAALRDALVEYDWRQAYRGPESRVAAATQVAEGDANLDAATALPQAVREQEAMRALPQIEGLPVALVLDSTADAMSVRLLDDTVVELGKPALEWAELDDATRPKAGDIIRLHQAEDEDGKAFWKLAQLPAAQGALVSLDPNDGAIRALVGGFDFYLGKFNRVLQAKRQPGSAFKPFLYSAALANGRTPATVINDAPVVFDDAALEDTWRPENYTGRFYGPTRLRTALTHSRNLVSIRLLRSLGIDSARDHMQQFGFSRDVMPRDLSLALGTALVSPLELARGYGVFANGGFLVEPYFIKEIRGATGELLEVAQPRPACDDCEIEAPVLPKQAATEPPAEEAEPVYLKPAPRVLDPVNAWLTTSMMQDVIQAGTARRARSLGRNDLAGKTGTTNEEKDAWFAGFNAQRVAVAWVGYDQLQPLGRGEGGGRAALPVWIDYMRVALDGSKPAEMPRPDGLVTVRIDPETGELANYATQGAIFETFPAELAPQGQAAGNGYGGFDQFNGYNTGSDSRDEVETVEDLF